MHERGLTGRGVGVGLLDTGVDDRHPAIKGRVCGFIATDRLGNRRSAAPTDREGHGTHMAGIIRGIAPEAELYAAAVVHGGLVIARIIEGLDWMLDQQVRVIGMPLGLSAPNPVFEPLLHEARRLGMLVVAPIGNGGAGQYRSPGDCEHVLSVGAVDGEGRAARFSGSWNEGSNLTCRKPDILALGVDVESASPGGGSAVLSGTSAASAYVAGIAALLFEARPDATPGMVEQAIRSSAVPLVPEQSHRAAFGIVDPVAAWERLREGKPGSVTESDVTGRKPGRRFVDPHLVSKLRSHGDGALGAVFQARSGSTAALIERAALRAGQGPLEQRSLRANVVRVTANRALLRCVLDDEDLGTASACDVDLWPWLSE